MGILREKTNKSIKKVATEQDVIMSLAGYGDHIRRYELMLPNVFITHDNESDLFGVRRSGLCDEFEVKISRSDFLADKKKFVRHRELEAKESGAFCWEDRANHPSYKQKHDALRNGDMCINYFWYAVLDGVATVDDIPDFAGLIIILDNGRLQIKKAPKKLHSRKVTIEERYKIARKSTYRFWDIKKKMMESAS